ncbi:hypothetical protein KFK09_024694 [Dendrobium nobile]|uniref:DUF4218 domain-containing protein n=1 Tax=Dendrobium nobile TaxID=94219 RepID=A0A8T3ADB0_DENNO|nr:hypothetical protein KFK09_024694 [Dendrobium nobile]
MVHLLIHLAEEVKLGGPVQYRWMYPFESGGTPLGKITPFNLDDNSFIQAHRYVLRHYDNLECYRQCFKDEQKRKRCGHTHLTISDLERLINERFHEWLRDTSKFEFPGHMCHWILQSLGEILEDVPVGVDQMQWCQLVNQWSKPADKTQACNLLAEEGLTPEEGNIEANERVFSIVMGPEHSGRVRTQGFGVTLTRYFPQSTNEAGGGSASNFGQIASLREEFSAFHDEMRQIVQQFQMNQPPHGGSEMSVMFELGISALPKAIQLETLVTYIWIVNIFVFHLSSDATNYPHSLFYPAGPEIAAEYLCSALKSRRTSSGCKTAAKKHSGG